MWVYTRKRHEHDPRFLINLDHFPSIAVNQLGERFFIDAGTGGETSTLASTTTEEEAHKLVQEIFDALEAGKIAIDLGLEKPKAEAEHGVSSVASPEPPKTPPMKAITK